jgi:sigma-E factor negative regulatory protein RseB
MALGLLAFAVHAARANDDKGRMWLERMAAAINHMSFQGTFVYAQGESLETMRITRIVDESGVHERLYSVNGPQREVLRDEKGVRCVLGDDKSVMEDPLTSSVFLSEIPLDTLTGEGARYAIQVGGIKRVAGRLVRKITIRPKDEYRYGYQLLLDQFSGLPLKWVLYDSKQNPIARLMFTELNLGDDIRREELDSPTPSEEFTWISSGMPDQKTLTNEAPKWRASELPPGFTLASHSVQEHEGESVFEHQVYSDGLASVSVYVEERSEKEGAALGASKIGIANAFSRNVGSKQVTVIGEVPTVTVHSIGNAVGPPPGERR